MILSLPPSFLSFVVLLFIQHENEIYMGEIRCRQTMRRQNWHEIKIKRIILS